MKILKFKILLSLFLLIICSTSWAGEEIRLSDVAALKVNDIRHNLWKNSTVSEEGELLINRFPWVKDSYSIERSKIRSSLALQRKAEKLANNEEDNFESVFDNSSKSGIFTGQIAFHNFMSPERAIEIILNLALQKELKADYSGERFILDPGYDLIGIGLQSIKYTKNGIRNGYQITIAFASSEKKYGAVSLNILNTIREYPTSSLSYVSGSYPNEIIGFNYWFYLSNKIPTKPLFYLNDFLTYSVEEQIMTVYPQYKEETINSKIEKNLAESILKELREESGNTILFNPFSKGILFKSEFLENSDSENKSFVIKSSILEIYPEEALNSKLVSLYAVVYKDKNHNGLYNAGEEISGEGVFLKDNATGSVVSLLTDKAGRINFRIKKNNKYTLIYKHELIGADINIPFSSGVEDIFLVLPK